MMGEDFTFVKPAQERSEYGFLKRAGICIRSAARLRNPLVDIAAAGLEEHRLAAHLQDEYALRLMGRRNIYWSYGRLLSGLVTSDIARAALMASIASGTLTEAVMLAAPGYSTAGGDGDRALARQLSAMGTTLAGMGFGEEFRISNEMIRLMGTLEGRTARIDCGQRMAVYLSDLEDFTLKAEMLRMLHNNEIPISSL